MAFKSLMVHNIPLYHTVISKMGFHRKEGQGGKKGKKIWKEKKKHFYLLTREER